MLSQQVRAAVSIGCHNALYISLDSTISYFLAIFANINIDSIHAQRMFMQQVEHENFVLNNENYDSITWCHKQSEQKSETGDFIGIQTLMFPYENIGRIGVSNVPYA